MNIKVNYQELHQAGQTLASQALEYESMIQRINQHMLSTSSIWSGSDNDAFIEHVQALQPELKKLVYVIQSYSDVLKTCASSYEQLQQNRLAQARNL